MTDKTLLLWGDTSVGKSTLLTAAFGAPPKLRALSGDVDFSRGADDLLTFTKQWSDLCRGGFQPSTQRKLEYALKCRQGNTLHVRDVKGGWVAEERMIRELLGPADAVLVVLEADAQERRRRDQERALRAASAILPTKVCGVALTKADRLFKIGAREWLRHDGWLHSTPYASFVEHGSPVPKEKWWPVSALGFDAESHLPACVLGEYDYVVPWGVNEPVNVRGLFEQLLSELDL